MRTLVTCSDALAEVDLLDALVVLEAGAPPAGVPPTLAASAMGASSAPKMHASSTAKAAETYLCDLLA
jgi:hypothetical protein